LISREDYERLKKDVERMNPKVGENVDKVETPDELLILNSPKIIVPKIIDQ